MGKELFGVGPMITRLRAERIIEVYAEDGLNGLFRRGAGKVLRSAGGLLTRMADRLYIWQPPPPLLSVTEQRELERNKIFKDKHKGQRCFIIGNGPSLKSQDLTPLAHELTFVTSFFVKHPIVEQWQPTYYFFAAPLFFDGSEPMQKVFAYLRSRIHSTTFFVPLDARQVVQQMSLLPPEKTSFVAFRGKLGDGLSVSPDFTQTVPGVINVAEFAIMAAMYMGCSPIYLLGLDHDWLAHQGMDKHFYEGTGVENHPQVHGDRSRLYYKNELQNILELWCGYEAILEVSLREGISILNATNGGFLDVFERVRYESLFHHRINRTQK